MTLPNNSNGERHIRPFTAFLQEHRNGRLVEELSRALADLLPEVQDVDKPGSITITLTAKPTAGGSVVVADKVTVKTPEHPRAAVYFVDSSGNPSRNAPGQDPLPLREVSDPAPAAEAKAVDL